MRIVLIVFLFILSVKEDVTACSAFVHSFNGGVLLGANTDACEQVEGLLIINKRNMHKTGSDTSTTGSVASWISTYGSVTFTYCCREIAQYGMNEAGLVISTVGLPGSRSPATDERPPLDGNIWAQYLLDVCANIDQVIQAQEEIRIVDFQDQYMLCDRFGNSAIIECRAGETIIRTGDQIPISILTNEKYDKCLLNSQSNYIPANDPYISNKRFQAGKVSLSRLRKSMTVDQAFSVLNVMNQNPCTQWNLVFDPIKMMIYYRTKQESEIRNVSMTNLDYSCATPMMQVDIHQLNGSAGSISFQPYSSEANLRLMRQAFKRFGVVRTEDQMQGIIDFFDGFSCE